MPFQHDPWIENRRHVKGYNKRTSCQIPRSTLRQLRRFCAACGADDASVLHVHHMDDEPTNNALDNLQVLCFSCHASKTSSRSRFGGVLGYRASRRPLRPIEPHPQDMTIREYLARYVPAVLSVAKSFRHYACRMPLIEGLRLKDITHERVLAVLDQMIALGATGRECRWVAWTMQACLKHASTYSKLDALPCPLPLPGILPLAPMQQEELFRTLQVPQADGRPWTGLAVAALMYRCYGVVVSRETGLNYLRRSGSHHRAQGKQKLQNRHGDTGDQAGRDAGDGDAGQR